MSHSELQLHAFEQALLTMDKVEASRLLEACKADLNPMEAVQRLVVPALENLGQRWESGEVALSQIYMGGRICEELVDQLLPPASPKRIDQPKAAITVLEDYHMLGKRMVFSTLRASGFELLDYGRTDVDELITRIIADRVEVLLLSTLMLGSALRVKEVRARLDKAGMPIKIVVGGAPFRLDAQLWREVGADATSATAAGAVSVISQIIAGTA